MVRLISLVVPWIIDIIPFGPWIFNLDNMLSWILNFDIVVLLALSLQNCQI